MALASFQSDIEERREEALAAMTALREQLNGEAVETSYGGALYHRCREILASFERLYDVFISDPDELSKIVVQLRHDNAELQNRCTCLQRRLDGAEREKAEAVRAADIRSNNLQRDRSSERSSHEKYRKATDAKIQDLSRELNRWKKRGMGEVIRVSRRKPSTSKKPTIPSSVKSHRSPPVTPKPSR